MCGICGFYSDSLTGIARNSLAERMMARLVHRGPDSGGVHSEGPLTLGFRRLSIIDLNTGDQPLSNEDATVWIAFNGEIYNFLELRDRLKGLGHSFRTETDTEAIVHAYEQYGKDCVNHLRGMFAFALWDARKRQLLLARDKIGKKPLYFLQDSNQFFFASELKALVETPGFKSEINYEALDYYLTYQYIPAPLTIFKSVSKLPPGHLMVVSENGKTLIEPYWDVSFTPKLECSFKEAASLVRTSVTEAVKARLISDVPLGALLSGGIDSSIVVGLMARLSTKPIKTFSIGFEEAEYDEMPFARIIARKFSTEHQELVVRPDIRNDISTIVYHLDEPMADPSSIPTFYVSKMARGSVKVILSGDGGDESFAGYSNYASVIRWLKLAKVPPSLIKPFLLPIFCLRNEGASEKVRKYLEACRYSAEDHFLRQIVLFPSVLKDKLYSEDLKEKLASSSVEAFTRGFFKDKDLGVLDKMLCADLHGYLPGDLLLKMDRMSMAHSLEARSPLLDQEVITLAARLPEKYKFKNKIGKRVLKEAFKDLLPTEILQRRKQGFAVPIGSWLRGPLREIVHDTLFSGTSISRDIFRSGALDQIVEQHEKGVADYGHAIWAVLVLEIWARQYCAQTYHFV